MSRLSSPKCRRWVFTLNNPTADHEQRLGDFGVNPLVRYLVYGRESAPTTGTRHLQGFFILHSPQRRSFLVNHLFRAYFAPANGTSEQAASYCKKENDFEEFGSLPNEQGKRTDLQQCLEWLDDFITTSGRAPTEREVATFKPECLLRYRNFMRIAELRAPLPLIQQGEPSAWQRELEEELNSLPNDRSVLFYVDPDGGKGKTWFQQWYYTNHSDKTQLLGVGKRDDMAFAVDASKEVFLINVPRGGMEYLQYTILEQIKDRMVFSPKYETTMKIIKKKTHVVVFCNEMPDMDKMSDDRYDIRNP